MVSVPVPVPVPMPVPAAVRQGITEQSSRRDANQCGAGFYHRAWAPVIVIGRETQSPRQYSKPVRNFHPGHVTVLSHLLTMP
jgi:hypothetical protein